MSEGEHIGMIPSFHIDEEKYRDIIQKYHISQFFAKKLQRLVAFRIVFILDDSGSMNKLLDESPLNQGAFKATRWDELQEFMQISIEITNILNPDGCDVYFLNRPKINSVTKFEEIRDSFSDRPGGFTPMTKTFKRVLKARQKEISNSKNVKSKKMLIMIVTDGEPTDNEGKVDIKSFKESLISRPDQVYTTIMACTDEENSMEYLNNWDKYIKRIDVVDDFRSERKEVRQAKGVNFPFSYGDYVAKSLVGSTDPSIDDLVEQNQNCCEIS